MNKSLIASAVLALGVSAVIPTFASADWRRDDRYERRDDWRHDRYEERQERFEEFDRDISLRDVPRNVMESVDYARRGHRIEAVQLVHRNGNVFYRFRIDDPGRRDNDMNIRVSPGGKIMGVEEARNFDPGYFRGR